MSKLPDIHLYTAATMNGWKPVIFLEEAGVAYELTRIDFAKREQKSAWYLKLNPNGRIPTIVDRGNGDFVVFESGAILWYLTEKFDRFLPAGHDARSQALQWLQIPEPFPAFFGDGDIQTAEREDSTRFRSDVTTIR